MPECSFSVKLKVSLTVCLDSFWISNNTNIQCLCVCVQPLALWPTDLFWNLIKLLRPYTHSHPSVLKSVYSVSTHGCKQRGLTFAAFRVSCKWSLQGFCSCLKRLSPLITKIILSCSCGLLNRLFQSLAVLENRVILCTCFVGSILNSSTFSLMWLFIIYRLQLLAQFGSWWVLSGTAT